jgi:hypothetical protein
MPRNTTKNQYYQVGISRSSRIHHLVETGAAGKTGADFIKMLVEDVDRLLHGEPAVVLSGLLAAKISLQPLAGETSSTETVPSVPESVALQQAALSRAARARRSYRMDEEDEEDGE